MALFLDSKLNLAILHLLISAYVKSGCTTDITIFSEHSVITNSINALVLQVILTSTRELLATA